MTEAPDADQIDDEGRERQAEQNRHDGAQSQQRRPDDRRLIGEFRELIKDHDSSSTPRHAKTEREIVGRIENFFSTRFSYMPAQIKKIILATSNFRFLYRMCN